MSRAIAHSLPKPLAPRSYSLLYYAAHAVVGWQPPLLIYYAMFEPMLTPRSAHRLDTAHNLHLRLLDLNLGRL